MGATIAVEMGEIGVSRVPEDRLQAFGLGACIGLCLYDPIARVGAMAHVVLPELPSGAGPTAAPAVPGKCAETAVPEALQQALAQGAQAGRLRAVLTGGAHIFSLASVSADKTSRIEIGPRNVQAVRAALERAGIPILAEEVGGHCGRTVTLHIGSGEIRVRAIGGEERLLMTFARTAAPVAGGVRAYGQ